MSGVDMTEAQFRDLFDSVSNWGRWDEDGGARGPEPPHAARVAAAARLVEAGVTITLSQPLRTEAAHRHARARRPSHDDADRRGHRIGVGALRQGLRRASTTTTMGTVTSTPSATWPSRVFFDGKPDSRSPTARRSAGAIDILKDGLVGRGVLLDVPRVRGVPGSSRGSTCSARTSRPRSATRG